MFVHRCRRGPSVSPGMFLEVAEQVSLRTSVIVRTGERWLIDHQKICCNVSCKNGCFLDSSRLEKVRSRYATQIIETESTEPDAILYTSLVKSVGW